MSAAKTTRKQRGRPFPKGKSGNPAGRPEGSRNKATILAQNLLDGHAEALVQKVIERALDGDMTALRVCLERLVPPRRDMPISFELPQVTKWEDFHNVLSAIVGAVSAGHLAPMEGEVISKLIERQIKILETIELERRIAALEAR